MSPLSLRKKMEADAAEAAANASSRSAPAASTKKPAYIICLTDEAPVFDFVWENGKLISATCPFDGNIDIKKLEVPAK